MLQQKKNWLLFIVSQPGKSQTPRIRLWRALKALGAAVLRDGVYLLPQRDDLQTVLEEQAQTIRESGGTAFRLEVDTQTSEEEAEFVELFHRGGDYAELLTKIRQRQTELATWNATQARRALQQLRRDFEAIRSIDYFPDSGLDQAEQAMSELDLAVRQQLSPDEPQPISATIERCDPAHFQGCTWATRAHLWVDRVACAWLIRRFIDPQSTFIWLNAVADCPPDALGFDFDGARFTHAGEGVTFEVLLASFNLAQDAGLARLGMLVHYLDVGGIPIAEAAGVEAILSGIRDQHEADDAIVTAMSPVFDALYSRYGQDDAPLVR